MKHCIIVSDSFKGTLTSKEICDIARKQIHAVFPACRVTAISVADGGEGTVDSLLAICGGQKVAVETTGPFGESITAYYGRLDGATAAIEMAAAAGLPLAEGRLEPGLATTYGVGTLIAHAVDAGAKEIILGLGGSCTNDAGVGCAAALGARFLDAQGMAFLPNGATLSRIREIDLTGLRRRLKGVRITAMCDIQNPLYGPSGAAYVFAPQKGADPEMVRMLDEELRAFEAIVHKKLGFVLEGISGAGAAGGFGAGCVALMGGRLRSGIDVILDLAHFDEKLGNCQLVITGEGRIDGQTAGGKTISGIARRTKAKGVPLIAIAGEIADDADCVYALGVTAMFSINRKALPFSESRGQSAENYSRTLRDILQMLRAAESISLAPHS